MKRAAVLAIFFAVAIPTLSAQDKAAPRPARENVPATTNFVVAVPTSACPVNMHALQGIGRGMVAVRGPEKVTGFAQRIHLVLSNAGAKQIVGARVKVSGLSGKSRVERASSSMDLTLDPSLQSDPGELTRMLNATFVPENNKDVATDLVLPGFTSVRSIQLESITYTDGTTWTVPGLQACHVAPDPMMLIAGR
ncbi:MAG: hypothetical protein WBV28_11735 [Terracidiphilus sp.]